MIYETHPVARNDYPCSECGQTIQAGERHTREAVPPWTLAQDDPDSPPFPIGEWWTRRFHRACDPRADR